MSIPHNNQNNIRSLIIWAHSLFRESKIVIDSQKYNTEEKYQQKLHMLSEEKKITSDQLNVLLILTRGDIKIYHGREIMDPDDFHHVDTVPDGSCMYQACMISFTTMITGRQVNKFTGQSIGHNLRKHIFLGLNEFGHLVLHKTLGNGVTIMDRILNEYTSRPQLQFAKVLIDRLNLKNNQTQTHSSLDNPKKRKMTLDENTTINPKKRKMKTRQSLFFSFQNNNNNNSSQNYQNSQNSQEVTWACVQRSTITDKDQKEMKTVTWPDSKFPKKFISSILEANQGSRVTWGSIFELDVISSLSHVDPKQTPTHFSVFQYDIGNKFLRLVYETSGGFSSSDEFENKNKEIKNVFIMSNGQNMMGYLGPSSGSTHFSCLIPKNIISQENIVTDPIDPVNNCKSICCLYRDEKSKETYRNLDFSNMSLFDIFEYQKKILYCKNSPSLGLSEFGVCETHIKEFKFTHTDIPSDMISDRVMHSYVESALGDAKRHLIGLSHMDGYFGNSNDFWRIYNICRVYSEDKLNHIFVVIETDNEEDDDPKLNVMSSGWCHYNDGFNKVDIFAPNHEPKRLSHKVKLLDDLVEDVDITPETLLLVRHHILMMNAKDKKNTGETIEKNSENETNEENTFSVIVSVDEAKDSLCGFCPINMNLKSKYDLPNCIVRVFTKISKKNDISEVNISKDDISKVNISKDDISKDDISKVNISKDDKVTRVSKTQSPELLSSKGLKTETCE